LVKRQTDGPSFKATPTDEASEIPHTPGLPQFQQDATERTEKFELSELTKKLNVAGVEFEKKAIQIHPQ